MGEQVAYSGMLPSLEHLDYLEALLRTGSVGATARELSVAQSTVYRRVAALEERLGVVVLSRGEGLTAIGEELARVASVAQAKMAGALRQATARQESVEGSVTLTTTTGMAPLLSKVLAALGAEHPKLLVEVHVTDAGGLSVRDGEADIAITMVPRPPASLVGRKIMRVRYAVFGRPSVAALAKGSGKNAPWVVLGRPMHETPQAKWERSHVPPERALVRTGSRLAFIEFVRSGVGLGVLPVRLGELYPELRRVSIHRSSLSKLGFPVWLLTHPELRESARVTTVLRALEAGLAD
ncbi:MAG: DNA-binding transcriptional LysR family regulator [Polyangiales bacterium]|jgi:DNA-binding transcriptional LysR family regulator